MYSLSEVLQNIAVLFSILANEQTFKIEQIQKICLKVILGEMYVSYSLTFEMTNLTALADRREKKMFGFYMM